MSRTILMSLLALSFVLFFFNSCNTASVQEANTMASVKPAPAQKAASTLKSGIDMEHFDRSLRPQDDFFRFVNGKWLKEFEIPADKSNYGSFSVLIEESERKTREIIEQASKSMNMAMGSDEQKVGDMYRSFMDSARIESLGLKPLENDFEKIDNIRTSADLITYITHARKNSITTPFYMYITQDARQSDRYAAHLYQSGLGMPDKDYYFSDNPRLKAAREKYLQYIGDILTLAGRDAAAKKAGRILEIETAMAKHHWTRVDNRDPNKRYNKFTISELNDKFPHINWKLYLEGLGISDIDYMIVNQPSYIESLKEVFQNTSMEDWKAYFSFHLLDGAAPYLPKTYADLAFDFNSRTLQGIEQQRPRWKRGVSAVNATLGEVVGRIYVKNHFKPEAKERMQAMVENLKLTFQDRIMGLEWMGEETKKQALQKLSKFNTKIGYPEVWKDYSALTIKNDDLIGNMLRSQNVEYNRSIAKLGGPIDTNEWFMTPQMVNAYYSPTKNEIVFPAAILQPPFFNMEADDAVNYGGIGAVIGHEISHGFDDQGRKSDGDGNLRDWWTEQDAEEFGKRAQKMVEQYNAFNPIDTMHVNGKLTLGENIGDLGGVTAAYYAYKRSLKGKPSKVIDGYTGEQRFFLGYAQIWRRKYRDAELRRRILTDPHSPSEYRVHGIIANMPEFYEAFEVKPGDKLYRSPEQMVKIW